MARKLGIAGITVIVAAVVLGAQEREDRTLLTQDQMTAIINEASGERAMHHVLELVPYQRVRNPEEYKGHFRESEVMAQFAKEYGFSNIAIESFAEGQAWQPTQGELWMTTPKSVKLYDIHDIALSLASLNASGDATGELVDVGQGRVEDLDAKDIKGKFVLAASGVGGVYGQAVQRGALGALAVSAIGAQRTFDFPNQIVSTTANATQPGTFAWALSPNTYRELQRILNSGQKVTIRSIVKSVQVPTRSEIVHAEIPGDGSTTQEVAIGGHLYEGVIKQGANDDNSGCALTLEIGRTYLKLINEGKLPRPKRTINFQWLAEISGTNAWLNNHPDKAKVIIGDLNFDMEAIRVSQSRSFWILQRTPDTFPSYLNDIAQSMMEYVADISRERVRFRGNGYAADQPVTSPHGSDDAFYIKIDKHYGSSDHVTYMQHGIPAVMFITWPDMWYHSSDDTPDKQDPTQYKRAAVVGTGALSVLASGTDEMAARVLNDNLGRGLSRMGESHTKGLGYMADATDAASLMNGYKEARVAIQHQAEVEKGVVASASVLWTNVDAGKQKTAAFAPLIDKRAAALLDEVKAAYQLQAAQRGATATEPAMTAEEREAANLVVEQVAGAGGGRGGGGGAGAGRGGGAGAAGAATAGQGGRAAAPAPGQAAPAGRGRGNAGPSLPTEFNAEFSLLLGKHKTALEIRDFLSGEFTPLPLADVMAVLRAREAAGAIRLVPKAR
jgi:aminopeptidase YwaD